MTNYLKKYLPLIFLLPFLFSCTTHYISQWQNYDEESTVADDGNVMIKNDTIGVSHAFNSLSGNVLVRIENYSQTPMLINLTKTALTINGKTFGYVDGKSTIRGWLDTFGSANGGQFGSFGGEIVGKPNTLFVPPLSYVEGSFANIQPEVRKIVGNRFVGNQTYYALFNYPINTNLVFYEDSKSPMKLNSFINYSLIDSNNNPIITKTVNQNFYLSGFFKVRNMGQKELNQNLLTREDLGSYSISKGHGTGILLVLVGIIGLGIVIGEQVEE
ncbi:hypothetical protein MM213_09980 [Belliella sp. R4-6]|uniref:Lipoprotein n=1 Tax=Belliella alkalica TaxID=1730871 RepID=A0ABS9VD54_9BACT|nr:hypothetical protein [Belliella alkalica]MCH7413813.1 hypothetical protein [Belliella alkalica]